MVINFLFNLLNSLIDLLIALFQYIAGLRQKTFFSLVNYNTLSHYCYLPSQLLFLYLIEAVFVCIIFQKRFVKKIIIWYGGSYFFKSHICSCGKYLALPSDVCTFLSNIYDRTSFVKINSHYSTIWLGLNRVLQCKSLYKFIN